MASTLKHLLDKQPNFIKKVAYKIIPFKYRYGKVYNEFWDLINKSKNWSFDESKNYQLQKLKEVLKHCEKTVVYYQNLLK